MITGRVARRGARENMRTYVTSGKYKGKYRVRKIGSGNRKEGAEREVLFPLNEGAPTT